jgi:endonuclease/exonuclease/phosphatase family metal-dependent hydrolase
VLNRFTWRGALAAALLAAVVVAPAAPAASHKTKAKPKPKPDVTVMSRNLYLGADIIKAVAATSVDQEEQQVQTLHQTVDQTNFPLRAKAIAKEVAANKPDLIGLQEVARYYRGADGVHDGVKNSTTVLYDFLKTVQKEIRAKGLSYKVVSEQTEIDLEVPSADGYDLRLKLGNAVLARTGTAAKVKVLKPLSANFKSKQLTVTLPDQTYTLTRGWAGMDGQVAGRKFRFIDPHAEAYSDEAATAQFKELLKTGAKSKTLPTIMAGDFNSDPTAKGAKAGGYNAVIKAGFKDTSKRQNTCCQDEKLDNPGSKLTQWIDHIVVRPAAKVLKTVVVGNKPGDKIGGLWPSDHAGLVAKLRLK